MAAIDACRPRRRLHAQLARAGAAPHEKLDRRKECREQIKLCMFVCDWLDGRKWVCVFVCSSMRMHVFCFFPLGLLVLLLDC